MNFKQQELVFYDNSNCFNLLNKVAENFLNDKHYFNGCESFLKNPSQALTLFEHKLAATLFFLENRITTFIKCCFFSIDYCSLISSSIYKNKAFNLYIFNEIKHDDEFELYFKNQNELELYFQLNFRFDLSSFGFEASISKRYTIKLFDDIDQSVKFDDFFKEKINNNALPLDEWIRKFRECENLFIQNHLKPFLKKNNMI